MDKINSRLYFRTLIITWVWFWFFLLRVLLLSWPWTDLEGGRASWDGSGWGQWGGHLCSGRTVWRMEGIGTGAWRGALRYWWVFRNKVCVHGRSLIGKYQVIADHQEIHYFSDILIWKRWFFSCCIGREGIW